MFEIEPGKDYGVITGDIIDSSSLVADDRKQLADVIRLSGQVLADWFQEAYQDKQPYVSSVAIFGGDSWQIVIGDPTLLLRSAIFMRASLLASPLDIDTRMAAAVGTIDFLPESGVEEADGEAFRLSGRLLNKGLRKRRAFGFVSPDAEVTARWDLVCHLIDGQIRTNWNRSRARAVCGALQGWTGQKIGDQWEPPVSQQVASRHLSEASWDSIEEALIAYESS